MQGKLLLQQANLEQTAVERRHLLEAIETLADGLQRENANCRHQRRQQQNQGKTHAHFLCHAQVGKASTHGPIHCLQSPVRHSLAITPSMLGAEWQWHWPLHKPLAPD
ncbi:hypothetical protein D9M72_652110 [compost metagenome]